MEKKTMCITISNNSNAKRKGKVIIMAVKKVRSFRISDENYKKVKSFVAAIESKAYHNSKDKDRIFDIIEWCSDKGVTLDEVKEAVEISGALKTLVKSLKDI